LFLVNNAGAYPYVSVEEMTEDTWDTTMNVNLKATYATAHFAVAHMRARGGGRIINMISRAGLAGLPTMTAYSAAKAGVTGFTYGLAKELMEDGITVNCIAPSAATERSEREASTRRARTGHVKFAEVERTSEQVAPSVAFLAGEAAAGITGRVFYVIGGEMTLYEPPTPSRSVIKQGLWEVDELTAVCATAFGTTLLPPVMSKS
jgi:NAD(P)-dependent dehydrogenase (short-subunit alcohol dehydrogenase family)